MGLNKTILLIIGLITCVGQVHAQTFDEWFRQKKTQIKYLEQQIAALEVYHQLLQEGYSAVHGGLQVIGDLKQGDVHLHHDYFASLTHVNPTILEDGQTKNGKQVYTDIMNVCVQVEQQCKVLTPSEKSQARLILSNLQTLAGNSYQQYQLLMANGHYQLTDDQRLQQINITLSELSNEYAFIRHFDQQLDILRVQQEHEHSDVSGLQQLYNH